MTVRRAQPGVRGVAMAVAAHPDDIEFLMAGTLMHLAAAGWETHYWNLASGSCGSRTLGPDVLRRTRAAEARLAARLLGAQWHPPLVDDLELFYEDRLLRRVAAVVRTVQPTLVLTHALEDYMEDHEATARLVATALFARGMANYRTSPPVGPYEGDAVLYHAMPHGLADAMGRPAAAELFVDVTALRERKRQALEAHASQQDWLDVSQGMNSYLATQDDLGRAVGALSGRFRLAEGWRRHNHLGYCAPDADPLAEALGPAACVRRTSMRRRPAPARARSRRSP